MSTTIETEQEDSLTQQILGGMEHIVSHPGTSQTGGRNGISACGLASLNFARVIFAKEADESNKDILQTVIAGETALEITAICDGWKINSHLEVDDIFNVPVFGQSLRLVETKYGRPSMDEFIDMLQGLQAIPTSCAVVITRPPEIIACMKLVINGTDVFVIFDSHSRPTHPDGAVFILNTSVKRTAVHLKKILPVDRRLLSENDLQWQAQLLANFSGHVFVSSGLEISPAQSTQTVMESSLTILALRAEISDLKLENSVLSSENKRLESEVQSGNEWKKWFFPEKQRLEPDGWTEVRSSSSKKRGSQAGYRASFSGSARYSNAVAGPSRGPNRQIAEQTTHKHKKGNEKGQHRDAPKEKSDGKITRRHFECRICMEEHIEDNIARIDSCGHSFCRECVKDYVGLKLGENRFPILCPVCMVGQGKGEPGVVSNVLVQQIGITEEQFGTWVELEMAQFSILLHCRGCKQSTFVDKHDFEAAKTIVCPLPDCPHIWCKACQQSIQAGGPQHSCDGSSELDHLMKERGWKYCPSCKTPFQKETGCNHMTCMSPGCNTHFCYVCGEAIIKSALPRDVQAATTTHYGRCHLFDEVADHGIPP